MIFTYISISIGVMLFINLVSIGLGVKNALWDKVSSSSFLKSMEVSGFKDFGTREFRDDTTPYMEREYKQIKEEDIKAIEEIDNVEEAYILSMALASECEIDGKESYNNGLQGFDTNNPKMFPKAVLDENNVDTSTMIEYGRGFNKTGEILQSSTGGG